MISDFFHLDRPDEEYEKYLDWLDALYEKERDRDLDAYAENELRLGDRAFGPDHMAE